MPQLLVSVRNADEARVALEAGVRIIDVKEPERGPLGAAHPDVVRDVVAAVGARVPVSVACGELLAAPREPGPMPTDHADTGALHGVNFVKWGLAGCGTCADWVGAWRRQLQGRGLEPHSAVHRPTVVAVAYADWRPANAPSPQAVLEGAVRVGCGALLIDTFEKSTSLQRARGLVDWLPTIELARLLADARKSGLLVALAGSLRSEEIPQLVREFQPDVIAVRGAACCGGRAGTLDLTLTRRLARIVHGDALTDVPRPTGAPTLDNR